MGTVVTFDVREPVVEARALEPVVAYLRWVEATFSVFRPGSEISRIGRGELSVAGADPAVRGVLATCERLRSDTRAAFDHHPDARLDPSGYVKGWAIETAAGLLERMGLRSFLVSGGGDIVARGSPSGTGGWRIGVRDPLCDDSIVGKVDLRDTAMATSGAYERGDHIWNAEPDLASASVIGPDLGVADALATAVFASGLNDIAWLDNFPGYDLVVVTSDRRVLRSPTVSWSSPAGSATSWRMRPETCSKGTWRPSPTSTSRRSAS